MQIPIQVARESYDVVRHVYVRHSYVENSDTVSGFWTRKHSVKCRGIAKEGMRQVPLERDISIAVNGCPGSQPPPRIGHLWQC